MFFPISHIFFFLFSLLLLLLFVLLIDFLVLVPFYIFFIFRFSLFLAFIFSAGRVIFRCTYFWSDEIEQPRLLFGVSHQSVREFPTPKIQSV